MTNTELLKEKINMSGYRLRFIAKKVGITYQALHNKIYNKTEFKQDEIQKLKIILELTHEEVVQIFFA